MCYTVNSSVNNEIVLLTLLLIMLTISVRDFQLKASYYLNRLPVVLTKRGKPIATINGYVNSKDENVNSSVNNETGNAVAQRIGWCQEHFERGVEYPLTKIEYRDENESLVFKGDVCPSCLADFKRLEKEKGALIIYE